MKSLSLAQPHAIIMVGIPGSGKSFFAEKFAETFGAPYIQLEALLEHTEDTEAAKRIAELHLAEFAKTKHSLVLDTDTLTRTERTELAKKLRHHGYEPLLVWVQTDTATAQYRNKKKQTPEAYDVQMKRFSPPHEAEEPVVISGKHTYATQARAVLKRLTGERAHVSSSPVAPPPARSTSIDVRRGN